jgi:hypothetical protein
MKKYLIYLIVCLAVFSGCSKPSRVEQYRSEKHERDSVSLIEQQRSLAYYESQLDSLMPVADSLVALFRYEKNEKYQDHGNYAQTTPSGLRILVRDDGKELLLYRAGKRVEAGDIKISGKDQELYDRAVHMQIIIRDIKELEKRIARTSLEIQKYEKRLHKPAEP